MKIKVVFVLLILFSFGSFVGADIPTERNVTMEFTISEDHYSQCLGDDIRYLSFDELEKRMCLDG